VVVWRWSKCWGDWRNLSSLSTYGFCASCHVALSVSRNLEANKGCSFVTDPNLSLSVLSTESKHFVRQSEWELTPFNPNFFLDLATSQQQSLIQLCFFLFSKNIAPITSVILLILDLGGLWNQCKRLNLTEWKMAFLWK
jgi:hypothetical protein